MQITNPEVSSQALCDSVGRPFFKALAGLAWGIIIIPISIHGIPPTGHKIYRWHLNCLSQQLDIVTIVTPDLHLRKRVSASLNSQPGKWTSRDSNVVWDVAVNTLQEKVKATSDSMLLLLFF